MSSDRQKKQDKDKITDMFDTEISVEDLLNDVVLVVNGKRIKTNSTLLAHNSIKFAQLISNAKQKQTVEPKRGSCKGDLKAFLADLPSQSYSDRQTLQRHLQNNGSKSARDGVDGRGQRFGCFDPLQIELSHQSYSNMKLLIRVIQNHDFKPDILTGEDALKILALTEEFGMKSLKRKCEKAMVETLNQLKEKYAQSTVPLPQLFKYLSAAEKYKLNEVKELCFDECSKCNTASHRMTIVKDRHISEKSKTKILNLICDKMTAEYDRKLKEIQKQMARKTSEIDEKRKDFVDAIEEWKSDLQQDVDKAIKEEKAAYMKLQGELEKQRITEVLTNTVQQTCDSLQLELEELKTEIREIVNRLEDRDINDGLIPPENFWQRLEAGHDRAVENIISWIDRHERAISRTLNDCKTEQIKTSIRESYKLEENFDNISTELSDTIKIVSNIEANYESEMIEHERTKVELMKQQRRLQKVNTWIKWAKPSVDDEARCSLYKHFRQRNDN